MFASVFGYGLFLFIFNSLAHSFALQAEIPWIGFANTLQRHFIRATRQDPVRPTRCLSAQDMAYLHEKFFGGTPMIAQKVCECVFGCNVRPTCCLSTQDMAYLHEKFFGGTPMIARCFLLLFFGCLFLCTDSFSPSFFHLSRYLLFCI